MPPRHHRLAASRSINSSKPCRAAASRDGPAAEPMLIGNGGGKSRCDSGRRTQMSAGSNTSHPSLDRVARHQESCSLRSHAAFRQGSDQLQRRADRVAGGGSSSPGSTNSRSGSAIETDTRSPRRCIPEMLPARHTDAGDTDHRASGMQGIGNSRIKLRAETDQTRCVGRRQFEHAR